MSRRKAGPCPTCGGAHPTDDGKHRTHAELKPAATWAVNLPAALRSHFEVMSEAWGASPEEQLVRYLEADQGLVDLAYQAQLRVAARKDRSA